MEGSDAYGEKLTPVATLSVNVATCEILIR